MSSFGTAGRAIFLSHSLSREFTQGEE